MHISAYLPGYTIEIAHLFSQSVHSINDALYTHEQKNAWAPIPPDYASWNLWCEKEKPLLAFEAEILIGFMSLGKEGYIDRAFVRPRAQGKGVGKALLARIEAIARTLNFPRLHTHASAAGRPFFEKHGFHILTQNSLCRGTANLTNFTMEKCLCGK